MNMYNHSHFSNQTIVLKNRVEEAMLIIDEFDTTMDEEDRQQFEELIGQMKDILTTAQAASEQMISKISNITPTQE